MKLLDPTYIRDTVSYSFGDESGHHLSDGYMKPANSSNKEFIKKYWECVEAGARYMTLFIDNIRLYRRSGIKYTAVEEMQPHVARLKNEKVARLKGEDLLALCASLPDMKFVIFTGFEDTPIDEEIFDKIPPNVLKIFACNCGAYDSEKVIPIFYGLQRKLNPRDNRQEVLKVKMHDHVIPQKLLYINLRIANNPVRANIPELFDGKHWVTRETPNGIDERNYRHYLDGILNHKFALCPPGNAPYSECHRDHEVLLMRRVPVLLRNPHVEYVFKNFPVLFVNSFSEVTEELLIEKDHLYQEMQAFNLQQLDIKNYYNKLLSTVEI